MSRQTNPRQAAALRRRRQSMEARALVACSFSSIAAGVYGLVGLAWGLIAAGILGAAFGLFLVNVDEADE